MKTISTTIQHVFSRTMMSKFSGGEDWIINDDLYADMVFEKRRWIKGPNILAEYNKNMGGVEKKNCLVSLYRSRCKSRRWYIHAFYYLLDTCVVNAWLLHGKEMGKNRKVMSPKEFRYAIADGLINCGKQRRGRPGQETLNKKINTPRAPRPKELIRTDGTGHWTVFDEQRQRCRHCKTGFTKVKCCKCDVHLCQNAKNNCSHVFHGN